MSTLYQIELFLIDNIYGKKLKKLVHFQFQFIRSKIKFQDPTTNRG